jgi:hypothetical protein
MSGEAPPTTDLDERVREIVADVLSERAVVTRGEMTQAINAAFDQHIQPMIASRDAGWESKFEDIERRFDELRTDIQQSMASRLTVFESQMQEQITHAMERVEGGARQMHMNIESSAASLIRSTQESTEHTLRVAAELASSRDAEMKRISEEVETMQTNQARTDHHMHAIDTRLHDYWRELVGDERSPGMRDTLDQIRATVREHDWWHSKVKWLFTTKEGRYLAVGLFIGASFFSQLLTPENLTKALELIGSLF